MGAREHATGRSAAASCLPSLHMSDTPSPASHVCDPPTRGRFESGSATARLALGLGAASTMTAARWLVFWAMSGLEIPWGWERQRGTRTQGQQWIKGGSRGYRRTGKQMAVVRDLIALPAS